MEIPLLPPIKGREYTLVLDLDDTLIKFEEKVIRFPLREQLKVMNPIFLKENGVYIIHQRPGLQEFLTEMDKYYELVVFTAAQKDV